MKTLFESFLKYLGLATLLSTVIVFIKVFYNEVLKKFKCEHCYKLQARLEGYNGVVLLLQCQHCNKEIQIEIHDRISIIKRDDEE